MSASASVTARRLTAAALTAGALVGAVALPASATDHARPDRPRVEISAVHHTAPGRGDRSNRELNKEWVELTNTKRQAINLSGWTLKDEDGRTYTFRHYRLEGRATVRVHTGEGRDSSTDVYQDRHNSVFDRRSDTVTLRNDHGRVIDQESWGFNRHHQGGNRH